MGSNILSGHVIKLMCSNLLEEDHIITIDKPFESDNKTKRRSFFGVQICESGNFAYIVCQNKVKTFFGFDFCNHKFRLKNGFSFTFLASVKPFERPMSFILLQLPVRS